MVREPDAYDLGAESVFVFGSIGPHAVKNGSEFARNRDNGAHHAAPFRDL
jgi:hypothetical protein